MNINKKYAIRKLAVGVASVSIGMFIANTPEVAQTLGAVGGGGVILAADNGTEITSSETTEQWKPEGNIIAQGEDGVPWELYENGYLLFKPETGKDTLSNPNSYGDTTWRNKYGKQIKAIGFSDVVYAPKNSSLLFGTYSDGFNNLRYIDASKLDTSKVTNMHEMFYGTSSLANLDVSNWNTSQVEGMAQMFEKASSLTNLDVSKWNTSNVTTTDSMFDGASRLTSLDVSKWDTSNVTEMDLMFNMTTSLTTLDVSNWDTSKVTNMRHMFQASGLTTVDVSKWNTSQVTDMAYMFRVATNLTALDISNWDTSKVKSMEGMFNSTNYLKELKLGQNFNNTTYKDNLFENLDNHFYTNKYTDRWVKEDGSVGPFTIYEWNTAYRNDPIGMSGTWVREKIPTKYTLNFDTRTIEKINPIGVEKDTQTTLPTPTVDNTGYKFLGWTKTQDGEVITDTTNIANPGETITLYAKWEKVNNITTERIPIDITTIYQGDNTLDKGQRNEDAGQVGEKEIITTYKMTPIIGELTEPIITENIITSMTPRIIKLGTKPTEIEKQTELPITEKTTNTLVRGKERITQGRPKVEKEITEYIVNENTGDITESKRVEIVDEGTPTVKEIGTREPNTIIRDVNGKDLTDDELSNYTNLEPNPTNTTDNGDLVYIVHKIVTKYKGNNTLELNKQVVEKDGKTDGVKLIQVGTKPTVTTIERDNKQIKQTTTYIVNEDTGALTPNTTEEIIGDVKPTTSNGIEAPLTFELLEYTQPISTNTPIDENGDLILPPVVDKLEYTGTLSTNTPVDDNGEVILPPIYNKEEYNQSISTNTPVDTDDNLILPPIVDIPEYKDDIVNEPQKNPKEKLEPNDNNKQTLIVTTYKSDQNQDVTQDTVNTPELEKNNVSQKQVLPKTNALYSTPYVLGLLLSVIGVKYNKKD